MTRSVLIAACACLALATGASTAAAATPKKAIIYGGNTNAAVQLKTSTATSLDSVKKSVATLKTSVDSLTKSNKSNADSIASILGNVPAIVDGLTQLKNGLTTLASAYQSVEYGAIAAVIGPYGLTPSVVSSDIPDDGNTASVYGEIPVTVPTAAVVGLRAAIRSNESDGKATGDPAGQVGALLFATTSSGALACTPVQTPARSFAIPDGTTRSLNLINIQQGDARTASTPFFNSQDALDGLGCNLPAAGTYILHVSAQFADIPTSLTPGPTD